ncbi:MAG: hypothetical protein IPN75_13580 [Dechloromonas sp.]|uniref:YjeF N-terminal domain-containing protein n=1 Tax=Candidatus Dechloromonas phosphorivorans TaxID=2899244 RepID=A0A9D7LSD7_9RHOO|nr:hypothetical protein [Candidatus Dechloromonas phosphorivorans]
MRRSWFSPARATTAATPSSLRACCASASSHLRRVCWRSGAPGARCGGRPSAIHRGRRLHLSAIPGDGRWSLIVDGLFGIGLARAPDGRYADWIATANRLAERDACPLLALDCPSDSMPIPARPSVRAFTPAIPSPSSAPSRDC